MLVPLACFDLVEHAIYCQGISFSFLDSQTGFRPLSWKILFLTTVRIHLINGNETLKNFFVDFFVVAFWHCGKMSLNLRDNKSDCACLVYFNFNVCCVIKWIPVGKHAEGTIGSVDFNLICSAISFFLGNVWVVCTKKIFFKVLKFYYFYSAFLKPVCKSLKTVLYVTNALMLSKLSICTSLMVVFNSAVCRLFFGQTWAYRPVWPSSQLVGKEMVLSVK